MKRQRAVAVLPPPNAFAASVPEPDLDEALQLVMQLMAIPGLSGDEAAVAEFIIARLREAGAGAAAIRTDRANRHTPLPGNTGNLILRLPGTTRAPRRLLMAHMDTVPICPARSRCATAVSSARPIRGRGWGPTIGPAWR